MLVGPLQGQERPSRRIGPRVRRTCAQVASHYKRLQRFFRAFTIDYDVLARLLVRLFPVGEGPWYVTLDRTHWKFGKADLNFLILGIAHQGMALPVLWTVLDKPGHSDTEERIALLQRFLTVFGASSIRALLADREFVGEGGLQWLQAHAIPVYLRLKRNTLIPNAWNVPKRADFLFQSLKPGWSAVDLYPPDCSGLLLSMGVVAASDGRCSRWLSCTMLGRSPT